MSIKNKISHSITLVVVAAAVSSCGVSHKTVLVTAPASTTITQVGTATDGSYIVSVTQSGTNVAVASKQAKKEAVRSILFDGLKSSVSTTQQKPIVADKTAEIQFKDYFAKFFTDDGPYLNFVAETPGQPVTPVKTGSGYKITITITVKKDALRKEMENNGIIKKLGQGL